MAIWQSAGKSWEYLVGVFLGDGCVTRQVTQAIFRLNTIDEDFALATKEAILANSDRTVSIHKHTVSKSSKPNFSLRSGDADICARLENETAGKTKLPDWIWTTDQAGRLAFIAGLMDSEGFVTQNGHGSTYMGFKSTDVWFADFIRVLNMSGIEIGKIGVEQPRFPGYRTPRRFSIKMHSWVSSGAYFNIQRKQARVEKWASQLTPEANTRNAA